VSDGWICPACGEIAQGELCTHCGKSRGPQGPVGPAPGSYLSMLGYHSVRVWKPVGAIMAVLLSAGAAFGYARPILLAIDALILVSYMPSAILTVRLLLARRRR